MVQQALMQQLTPIFEPAFNDRSFGFRLGRSAHNALRARAGEGRGGERVGGVDGPRALL